MNKKKKSMKKYDDKDNSVKSMYDSMVLPAPMKA